MKIPRRFLPSTSVLIAFEAVARNLNFSKAAMELHLTQSAVSRQIKALEEQLGVNLFERRNKKITITDAGKSYLLSVDDALTRIVNATVNICANPQGGTLNIAILPTFGTRWLAPKLNDFINSNPGIDISISTQLNKFDFSKENFDIAVHFGDENWDSAICEYLMEEIIIPVCSAELKDEKRFNKPEDLLAENLLYLSSRPKSWKHWFENYGVEFKDGANIRFDQFATISQAAISGIGVALLPDFLIQKELKRGELVKALDLKTHSKQSYYIVYPEIKKNYPPLKAFRNWIVKQSTL